MRKELQACYLGGRYLLHLLSDSMREHCMIRLIQNTTPCDVKQAVHSISHLCSYIVMPGDDKPDFKN